MRELSHLHIPRNIKEILKYKKKVDKFISVKEKKKKCNGNKKTDTGLTGKNCHLNI